MDSPMLHALWMPLYAVFIYAIYIHLCHLCLGNTACFDLERQSTSAMCLDTGDCMIQTATLSPSWSLKQPWLNWTRKIIFASSPASQVKRKANLRKSVQLETCKAQILAICSSELITMWGRSCWLPSQHTLKQAAIGQQKWELGNQLAMAMTRVDRFPPQRWPCMIETYPGGISPVYINFCHELILGFASSNSFQVIFLTKTSQTPL